MSPAVRITGSADASTAKDVGALAPTTPNRLACDAWAVYVPLRRAGPRTENVPDACGFVETTETGIPLTAEPAKIFTLTVRESSAATLATPPKFGLASVDEPAAGVSNKTVGADLSVIFALAKWAKMRGAERAES
jgi:hypothetical protein